MDLLPTGSDELVYIRTDKVNLTIKGPAAHPNFQGVEYREGDSEFKLSCSEEYELSLKGCADAGATMVVGSVFSGVYTVTPLFYEQQRYEIVIESNGDHEIAFWHDNLNIRNKVTRVGRNSKILSGVINFGNEIGLSDLVVKVDGANYLRVTIEVFPTKISYKDDYKAIVEDVTREVYGLVFDFLKKTYLGYQQSDRVISSPVEFFAVIRHIFGDFMKAADMILAQPHHLLETTHEVLPSHKIKRTDNRSLRWIEKHPDQAIISADRVLIAKTLAVKKLMFELVREVGLRMPKAVGSAVGIVGSLIIGDAAVEAGIVSAPVLMVVAFSAVCNFLAPPYMNSNVVLRGVLILSAGFFGVVGLGSAAVAVVAAFASKKSFGTPYFSPLLPFNPSGQSDFLLMLPIWRQKYIPSSISGKKIVRARKKRE